MRRLRSIQLGSTSSGLLGLLLALGGSCVPFEDAYDDEGGAALAAGQTGEAKVCAVDRQRSSMMELKVRVTMCPAETRKAWVQIEGLTSRPDSRLSIDARTLAVGAPGASNRENLTVNLTSSGGCDQGTLTWKQAKRRRTGTSATRPDNQLSIKVCGNDLEMARIYGYDEFNASCSNKLSDASKNTRFTLQTAAASASTSADYSRYCGTSATPGSPTNPSDAGPGNPNAGSGNTNPGSGTTGTCSNASPMTGQKESGGRGWCVCRLPLDGAGQATGVMCPGSSWRCIPPSWRDDTIAQCTCEGEGASCQKNADLPQTPGNTGLFAGDEGP
jgi:hypothetical protein